MEGRELLRKMSNSFAPTGCEKELLNILKEYFGKYTDEITFGRLGDFIAIKRGKGKYKIMIAAHADEIGLVVKDIDDKGLISFLDYGWVDPKTLPAQEVIIHGRQKISGVIGTLPPHILSKEDMKKPFKIDEMIIDTGLTKEEIDKYISIGDFISIKGECKSLKGDWFTGKAMDNRSGIAVMYECAKLLKNITHEADVYFVATTMEEIGHYGAKTTAYEIQPDIGIAVDVTFGDKYADTNLPSECGGGVEICLGPALHSELSEKLMELSANNGIPYTIDVASGNTGTDAWDIQNVRESIPTLMLSVPVRYMHTSVETVKYSDIECAARLLAVFIEWFKDWRQVYEA